MKLVCIKIFTNRAEAEMTKNFLEKNRVKSVFSADDVGGANPALLYSRGGVKLLVKKEDREKALEILTKKNE